jgi:hypothetical protein
MLHRTTRSNLSHLRPIAATLHQGLLEQAVESHRQVIEAAHYTLRTIPCDSPDIVSPEHGNISEGSGATSVFIVSLSHRGDSRKSQTMCLLNLCRADFRIDVLPFHPNRRDNHVSS